eukprot:scaffold10847_cov17-Tisochrysis_lutea.AAC.5
MAKKVVEMYRAKRSARHQTGRVQRGLFCWKCRVFSALKLRAVQGLSRSDDLSRMLPSEMAMMAHGWPRKAPKSEESR